MSNETARVCQNLLFEINEVYQKLNANHLFLFDYFNGRDCIGLNENLKTLLSNFKEAKKNLDSLITELEK